MAQGRSPWCGRRCVPQGRKSLGMSLELQSKEKAMFPREVVPEAHGESSFEENHCLRRAILEKNPWILSPRGKFAMGESNSTTLAGETLCFQKWCVLKSGCYNPRKQEKTFIFSWLYISFCGKGKVTHNVLNMAYNSLVNIRILFWLESNKFEARWFLMLSKLFDSTWGKVFG